MLIPAETRQEEERGEASPGDMAGMAMAVRSLPLQQPAGPQQTFWTGSTVRSLSTSENPHNRNSILGELKESGRREKTLLGSDSEGTSVIQSNQPWHTGRLAGLMATLLCTGAATGETFFLISRLNMPCFTQHPLSSSSQAPANFAFLNTTKSQFLNFPFAKCPCCHLLAVASWPQSEPALSLHCPSSAAPQLLDQEGQKHGEGNAQGLLLGGTSGGFQARPKHSQWGRDTGRGSWCALPWQDERQSCRHTQTMWIPAGADLTQWLPGLCCSLVSLFDVPWWLHPAPYTPMLCAHTPVSPVPGPPKDTGPDDLWCPVQCQALGHPRA